MNMRTSRNRSALLGIFTVLVILGLLYGFYSTLKSQVATPPESASALLPPAYVDGEAVPIQANIGVYAINVGSLDLATGIYWMDFYLTIRCDRPCDPDPDILNAVSAPEIELQFADTQGDTFYSYRVRANLLTDVQLENFPFDEQKLVLFIGDKQSTISEMKFIADPTLNGLHLNLHVLGWSLKPEWEAIVIEDAYPINLNLLYSRLLFSSTVYKPWLSSFINSIFPALVIMLVGLLSFLMSEESAGERLALTSSTLLAIILFHIELNSDLPPLASLTYADKFMLVNYAVATISIGISAILLVLKNAENADAAKKLHARTRWIIPPLWAVLLLAITIWQFNSEQIMARVQG